MVRILAVAFALAGCGGGFDNTYVEIGTGLEGGTYDGETAFGPSLIGAVGTGLDDGEGLEFTAALGASIVNDGARFRPAFAITPLMLHFDQTTSREGARAWRWSTVGELGALLYSREEDRERTDAARFGLGVFSGPAIRLYFGAGINVQASAGPHVMWGIHDMVAGGAQVRLRFGIDKYRR